MTAPPDALILAFDTSAAHCAAVLLSADTVAAQAHEAMPRGQAERLFPMIQDLLARANVGFPDLAAIAVGTGPGNFTGLRVAVSAARGLALATGLPAFGVDGFDARALGTPAPCLVGIAGPRGTVHARRAGPGLSPEVLTLDEPCARHLAASEGLALVGEVFAAPPAFPLAEAAARIASRRHAAGERPPRPAPFYVRPPDAAPARAAAPAP